MKIAICTRGNSPQAPLDPRFGRCSFFALVETAGNKWEFIPNPAAEGGGGAGIQAAQELAGRGVGAVIAGQVGPNAMAVLKAAGIDVYCAAGSNAEEAFTLFLQNALPVLPGANAQPHAGRRERRA
ncbi:MAG: NifB/NifX family molybdenum-iron cluster-binding protein [Desulfotomaculales bacterium]